MLLDGLGEMAIVEVTLLTGVPKPLYYNAPPECIAEPKVGQLVRVPLQRRSSLGIITKIGIRPEDSPFKRLKAVQEFVYQEPIFSEELLKLARWIGHYYAAGLESVLDVMIPKAVKQGGVKEKVEKSYKLVVAKYDPGALKRAAKQVAACDYLLGQPGHVATQGEIIEHTGVTGAVLKALVDRGLVELSEERIERNAYQDNLEGAKRAEASHGKTLSEAQAEAADAICASIDAEAYKTHLVHGVTGSGKTEVYLQAILHAIQKGLGVILLVPEVALAPQTVARLRDRLASTGIDCIVWHSMLSDGERFDAWKALTEGRAQVVVGARSAIFAPVKNLGLIIVDEEHEPSYKQGDTPRYHGRDVAVYRAFLNKAVCVLGSATPSLESLYNVEHKGYVLNKLPARVDGSELPRVHIVDMRVERLKKHQKHPSFSQQLRELLIDRMEKREQAILFINRRGFSPSLLCEACGDMPECPHCSVTLTFHQSDQRLRCHLCGHVQPSLRYCGKCKSKTILYKGAGTQRVEEQLKDLLPKARIARIDADTMSKKNRFREIFSDFRRGKIDCLIGTQMIAKGLDFPNVTLVGLIDADLSLHVQDFRAHERTFQLVVQVAGRAGRGDRAGEVVIQTNTPHAAPIQFARRSDFDGYLEEELALRKEHHYPPYRHLVRHIFRCKDLMLLEKTAEQWADYLDKHLPDGIELRGPAPAPIERVKDYFRYHLWFFTGNVSRSIGDIMRLRAGFNMPGKVLDVLDVDPIDLC